MVLRIDSNRYPLVCGVTVFAALLLCLVFASAFLAPSAAHAFGPPISDDPTEVFSQYTCAACHNPDPPVGDPRPTYGPHKGYMATTNKCALCHAVHNAPAAAELLLRGTTVSQTCLMCHDGTASGMGPYDSITAHAGAGAIQAQHRVEVNNVIPGGTTALSSNLSCGDCHSVHGANTVAAFVRDGTQAFDTGGLVTSDCLLSSEVNTTTPDAFPVYGAQWCASCHDQRHSSSSTVLNHPVNAAFNFGYGDVITKLSLGSLRFPNEDALNDLARGMGQTNGGYIMTEAPEPEVGDGRVTVRRDPLCMQCHEDARNVEAIYTGDVYSPGVGNPAYLTFPHQTTAANMLVESNDDLCLNCHALSTLP